MKQVYYTVNQFKLTPMANEILFQKRIKNLFEELFRSYDILLEEDSTEEQLNSDEQKAMDTLIKSFTDAIKAEKSTIQSTANDEAKIDQIEKKYPELKKLDDKLKEEGKLNEFVITATLVAGIVAAIPSLIKIFGWLVYGIGSLLGKMGFEKAEEKTKRFAEKVIHFGHDVHVKYIQFIDKAMVGLILNYGSIPEHIRLKIAEAVYMIIVISLGITAGVAAYESFTIAHWIHGGVEGALAAVKAGEIGVWITDAIAAALGAAAAVA